MKCRQRTLHCACTSIGRMMARMEFMRQGRIEGAEKKNQTLDIDLHIWKWNYFLRKTVGKALFD